MGGAQHFLVLGGGGFVGRHVVARLAAGGHRVTVPTRRREAARHLILLPTVQVIEADVHDPAALGRLAQGATVVVNLVGILHEQGAATFARIHVELARTVVGACRSAGVTRLLHMSAINADPAGPSRYLQSKGEAEAIVADSGLAWTMFRPSVVFGPGDSFVNLFAALARRLPVIPLASPHARFAPVYVGDVAECIVRSSRERATIGRRYGLCGPQVYTLRDLVAYIAKASGHPRLVVPLSPALSRLQARMLELLPGKLMTRDNLDSMRQDAVCAEPFPAVFAIAPTALEAIAPSFLSPIPARIRQGAMRAHADR
jgi:NADH dehydrogenase